MTPEDGYRLSGFNGVVVDKIRRGDPAGAARSLRRALDLLRSIADEDRDEGWHSWQARLRRHQDVVPLVADKQGGLDFG